MEGGGCGGWVGGGAPPENVKCSGFGDDGDLASGVRLGERLLRPGDRDGLRGGGGDPLRPRTGDSALFMRCPMDPDDLHQQPQAQAQARPGAPGMRPGRLLATTAGCRWAHNAMIARVRSQVGWKRGGGREVWSATDIEREGRGNGLPLLASSTMRWMRVAVCGDDSQCTKSSSSLSLAPANCSSRRSHTSQSQAQTKNGCGLWEQPPPSLLPRRPPPETRRVMAPRAHTQKSKHTHSSLVGAAQPPWDAATASAARRGQPAGTTAQPQNRPRKVAGPAARHTQTCSTLARAATTLSSMSLVALISVAMTHGGALEGE